MCHLTVGLRDVASKSSSQHPQQELDITWLQRVQIVSNKLSGDRFNYVATCTYNVVVVTYCNVAPFSVLLCGFNMTCTGAGTSTLAGGWPVQRVSFQAATSLDPIHNGVMWRHVEACGGKHVCPTSAPNKMIWTHRALCDISRETVTSGREVSPWENKIMLDYYLSYR